MKHLLCLTLTFAFLFILPIMTMAAEEGFSSTDAPAVLNAQDKTFTTDALERAAKDEILAPQDIEPAAGHHTHPHPHPHEDVYFDYGTQEDGLQDATDPGE